MIKHQVKFSGFAIVMTALSSIILFVILIVGLINEQPEWQTYLLSGIVAVLFICASFYAPMSLSVDDKNLYINRLIRVKAISLSDIESVELCAPTMAERRISGSGGWFGYWGWFKEPSIGKYFAYYGKASDCFLVTLKDGRRYLLGCVDPKQFIKNLSC